MTWNFEFIAQTVHVVRFYSPRHISVYDLLSFIPRLSDLYKYNEIKYFSQLIWRVDA